MPRPWLSYPLLGLFSAGVGFMVGGGLDALQSEPAASYTPPAATTTTTTITTTTLTTTTTATTAPSPTSVVPETSTSTSSPTTTSTSTTTVAPTTTTPELVARDALTVAVANGAGYNGLAGDYADTLVEVGYIDPAAVTVVRAPDGGRLESSTVYFVAGFEGEAERLAADASLPDAESAPADELPELIPEVDVDLYLVVGIDAIITEPPLPGPPAPDTGDAGGDTTEG